MWLKENSISVTIRDVIRDTPRADDIAAWHHKSGMSLKKFFNTSGRRYRELNIKERLPKMTDKEQYQLLASDGMLLKRPIFITNAAILIGFNEKIQEEILKA